MKGDKKLKKNKEFVRGDQLERLTADQIHEAREMSQVDLCRSQARLNEAKARFINTLTDFIEECLDEAKVAVKNRLDKGIKT